MSTRSPIDLLVTLDRGAAAPEGLTRQIYAQLRAAIVERRLRASERLPPSRALASALGVARLTVATAYEWLRAEGFVYGRVGAGTFVATAFEAPPAREPSQRTGASAGSGGRAPAPESAAIAHPTLSSWARRIAELPLLGAGTGAEGLDQAEYDFRPGVGAADAFPWARWRRAAGQFNPGGLAEPVGERAGDGGRWDALLGPPAAREAIAAWLRRSRAVRCAAEQILIAASVQQVLALLARLLLEPGQRVLTEDPSYVGFQAAFLAEGARLEAIAVDGAGLRVDSLPDPAWAVQESAARLAIVTPSHQYPSGVTLSLERRVALLGWARRAGVVVLEDDYDGDLRLEGQPLEALCGLDDRDEVIYLGTFAKALYPAVRVAFAVLPSWLVEPVARARAASDRHPRWHDARAVARFIDAGELERHLARVRRLYRTRRDALLAALRAELDGLVIVGPAEAGIHLEVRLPPGVDDVALCVGARARGLALTPLSPHYRRDPCPGLLLGFGAMDEARLRAGVRALAPLVRAAAAAL